jgi:hypothetical protein
MSIEFIQWNGKEILYFDLKDSKLNGKELEHLIGLNQIVINSKSEVLVLVNALKYMPGRDFMEMASRTLNIRSDNIKKAAYVGVEKYNKRLFEQYDKFNLKKVNRKLFNDIESALAWLIE